MPGPWLAASRYLAQPVVRVADVGSGILEVGAGDEVPEAGLHEPVVAHPAHLRHARLAVHLAEELGRVVTLHADGVLGAHSHSRVI